MNHVVPLLIAVPNPGQLSAISVVPMYTAQDAFCKSNGFTYVLQDAVGLANGTTILDTLDDVTRQWVILNNTHSGGGGGIATLTSTGTTVTITNPGGPVTNIDVQIATGEVATGGAGNLLSSSANFTYDQATHTLQVIGDGVIFDPSIRLQQPPGAYNQINMQSGGVDSFNIFATTSAGASGGQVLVAVQTNGGTSQLAGFSIGDETFAKTSLLALVNRNDIGLGAQGLPAGAVIGFPFIPSINGPPVGPPTSNGSFLQRSAIAIDPVSIPAKLWVFVRGGVDAWKSCALT